MTNSATARSLAILGTRGVPAGHGGFETFAARLAPWLVARGWQVTVYCQIDGSGAVTEDEWQGVHRVNIPIDRAGAVGTMQFDWRTIDEVLRRPRTLLLTLGYNTALFTGRLKARGFTNVINMDGLEWMRAKWKAHERGWLWLNERAGARFGTHLVADHPEIERHLQGFAPARKITMIPYGADDVTGADPAPLAAIGVEPDRFLSVIARPEPENSFLEIVRAFSRRPRGYRLLVLGKFDRAGNDYHGAVLDAASNEVMFPGPIYEADRIAAIRAHSTLYCHGHTVGGTNPSLVEALGAGAAVLAHDNPFNRWVAGDGGRYFPGEDGCANALDRLLAAPAERQAMRAASTARFGERFRWEQVLGEYEDMLSQHLVGQA